MGFQSTVNVNQAPAVAGDFASQNPRASVLAAAGQLVAPSGGLTVGNFCFVNPADGTVHTAYSSGYQVGILGRNSQGLITVFLGESSMVVPQGFPVTLFDEGDFYAKFAGGATAGQAVYADENTGAPVAGSATDTATGTIGYAGTASFATNVMTLVTTTNGVPLVGDVVVSAGVTAGTTVTAAIDATHYTLSTAPGTIATQAATTTSLFAHVTAILTGALNVGDPITGTGVTGGTTITSVPAAGGVGNYGVSIAQTAAGPTLTVTNGNVATGFTARSNANAGELAIISSWGV